jgi:predicted ferric reductase
MVLAAAPKAVWYLTRGSGIVALLLLTVTMVFGVMTFGRQAASGSRFVVTELHRNLSLLAVAFLVIHIVTSVADGFVPIRWIDAVVPFGSSYQPFWLGIGAASFDLLLAVIVTSLVRARLGHRAWRAVHWLAYAAWPVAVAHSIGIGSDSSQGWAAALYAACIGAVVIAVGWRIAVGRSEQQQAHTPPLSRRLSVGGRP